MMKQTFVLILFLLIAAGPFAQVYTKLLKETDRQLPFEKIAAKINRSIEAAGLKEDDEEGEEGYNQWKRLEWFALQHLNRDGVLEDFARKNEEALQTMQQRLPANVNTPQVNNGGWFNIGYTAVSNAGITASQGRVNCFAFDSNDGNILYAGTAGGGIWKTFNGGTSWFNISDQLPVTTFSGLAVHPNGSTIYALTGDGFDANFYIHDGIGVLRSDDGGSSWRATALNYTTSSGVGGYKIQLQPSNSNVIIAAMSNGLWRSVDGGNSWTTLRAGFSIPDFEFKPDDSNILYYTISGLQWVYKLDLTTLNETSTSIPAAVGVSRIELGVSVANANVVYALAGPGYNTGGAGTPNGTAMYNGLYYSSDAAASFTKRNDNIDIFALNNDQSWYDIVLRVNPGNSNDVVMGGVRTYRSTDGGINFSMLNSSNPHLHGDNHALERSPVNGNLYLGDDGGIYRSSDNGATWVNTTGNIVINEFYRIHGYAGNNEIIIGGTQDNGQFIRPGATTVFFGGILGLDGMDNIIDFTNSAIMYACTQNGGLNKSVNGGLSFAGVNIPGGGGRWITPIIQSPTAATSNTIYYGANSGILRSANGGSTWVNIGGQTAASCMGIGTDGVNISLYTSAGSNMRRCDNPGAATPVWNTLTTPAFSTISSIAVNPANKNEVWFSCSGYNNTDKVFRSQDGGATWTNLTLSLPNIPVYSIAFANNSNSPGGAVYVGTELGVYYTDDGIPDWEPFYNGLPAVPVTDLFVNYNTGDITAATFGRGIWRSSAYSSCPGSYSIYGTITGNQFYQSSGSITSLQVVPGTAGNALRLRAAGSVTLSDGFRAYNGAYLHVTTGTCGSGVVVKPTGTKNLKSTADQKR